MKLRDCLKYDLSIFDQFHSIIDYFSDNLHNYIRLYVWKDHRGWWINEDYLWNISKSKIAQQEKIDLLIDDMKIYKTGYLFDRFILYQGQDDIEQIISERLKNT